MSTPGANLGGEREGLCSCLFSTFLSCVVCLTQGCHTQYMGTYRVWTEAPGAAGEAENQCLSEVRETLRRSSITASNHRGEAQELQLS